MSYIYILYTMYIRFSTIKEKLNFLLFNMYLKEEKKKTFQVEIFH